MAITLANGATTLELHPDLLWVDRHSFSPVVQSVERSVTGGLLVEYGVRQAGKPITLQPEDESSAWMPKSTLDVLEQWASVAGQQMSLSIDGVTHTVIFRHIDGALEASPVVHFNDTSQDDYYRIVLRFLEI